MAITHANKTVSRDSISCGDSFQITLSLTADPDIAANPTDIVMILDRSGSMRGDPLAALKTGAKAFIDVIEEATDGVKDGVIGGGSRIGIVSFATTATQDTGLITSVDDLRTAVNALQANGNTNHSDAFTKALALFDPTSDNKKVMVMFTDGETTIGGDANPIATAAKAQGVLIYVIGLNGSGGIDETAIKEWASDPDSEFVAITPNPEELAALFERIALSITGPGANDVVVTDIVDPCFTVTALSTPTKGTATKLDDRTVRWEIETLGVVKDETASFTFTVEHTGSCTGTIEVNESTEFEDEAGDEVDFPSPTIEVSCGEEVPGEACPEPVAIDIDGCEDAVVFDAGDLNLSSLGRILQVTVTIKNVCPNRRVALAVILTEVDEHGLEFKRGLKTLTIPAHHRSSCQDVTVQCIKFILPEDLDVSGEPDAICNPRSFNARFLAHYIDNDFECCPPQVTSIE